MYVSIGSVKSSKKNKSFKIKILTENRSVNKKINGIKPEFNTENAYKKTRRPATNNQTY